MKDIFKIIWQEHLNEKLLDIKYLEINKTTKEILEKTIRNELNIIP